MLKSIEKLITKSYTRKYNHESITSVGNHRKRTLMSNPDWEIFSIFDNDLFSVDHNTKAYKILCSYYKGHARLSTTVNSYIEYFSAKGYEDVTEKGFVVSFSKKGA